MVSSANVIVGVSSVQSATRPRQYQSSKSGMRILGSKLWGNDFWGNDRGHLVFVGIVLEVVGRTMRD
jgi:hypothetical protein